MERRLDGGGDELRGLRVDDDVPAEQHAADDLPGVPGRVLREAAMSAILLEVVVHGGAVDADGFGDLGDGVLPLAVRPGSLVHAAHRGGLPVVQLGLAAAGAPAGPGGVEALAGALDDQLALELVDRAENMEDQSPGRRGGVDLLAQDDQADARSRSSSASASRCFSDRIARDSRVMTNTSPSRR